MVDQGKIDAYRPGVAEQMSKIFAAYVSDLDASFDDAMFDAMVAGGPRLHMVHVADVTGTGLTEGDYTRIGTPPAPGQDARDRHLAFTASAEPTGTYDSALWLSGLKVGLWIHSDRIGKWVYEHPAQAAEAARNLFGMGVVLREVLTNRETGVTATRRCWLFADRLGNTYTWTRGLTGDLTGDVNLRVGWLDPDWDHDELSEHYRDFGYSETHCALARMIHTFLADREEIVAAHDDGAFDVDPEVREQLHKDATTFLGTGAARGENTGGGVLDQRGIYRHLVRSHGYVPYALTAKANAT